MLKKLFQGVAFVIILFALASCGATKKNHEKRIILQGIDSVKDIATIFPEPIIQKGDLLSILVYSDNQAATEIYNQPQNAGSPGTFGGGNNTNLAATGRGYLVDVRGQIYFHSIGNLVVVGMTKKQLSDSIEHLLQPVLQNVYVVIRNSNAKITILGEVNKPGTIDFPDQRMSILDAIGLAGDLTNFARRDNVLVVRDVNGIKKIERIDLRNTSLYKSPAFYLQQNDMVYIEPNRKKPTGNEQTLMRNITIATSLLSAFAIILTLLRI